MRVIIAGKRLPNVQQEADILARLDRTDGHEIRFAGPWPQRRWIDANFGQSWKKNVNGVGCQRPGMAQNMRSGVL